MKLTPNKKNIIMVFSRFIFGKQLALVLVIFISGTVKLFPQWVNDPNSNTKLVVDVNDPVNISVTEDGKGGAYLVWEDKFNGKNDVRFLHFDSDGRPTLRADGKQVSQKISLKTNPYSSPNIKGTAVAVWEGTSSNNFTDLFAQRVEANGNLAWSNNGVQLTFSGEEEKDYSLSTDLRGNTFISYLLKPTQPAKEKVMLQKISPSGKLLFDTSKTTIYVSADRKSQSNVLSDENGGAFVFWLENKSGKTLLYGQRVDSTGRTKWGKNPVLISNSNHNVLNYNVYKTPSLYIYITWQIQNADKDIYHQLLLRSGSPQWSKGGKRIVGQSGIQSNPQAVVSDSIIFVCWSQEMRSDKNILLQKFNIRGKNLWDEKAIKVNESKGEHFGQKIIQDNKGGVIIAWINRTNETDYGKIFSQRVKYDGSVLWDKNGVPVASNNSSLKSYLYLISDLRGGAIIIFKGKNKGVSEIYGQKIFSTGTFISQIVGFTTQLSGDSIKISWYSANESPDMIYYIERSIEQRGINSSWEIVDSLFPYNKNSNSAYYEYLDKPYQSGTIFYRILQKDSKGNSKASELTRIDYLFDSNNIIVAQNDPNPFSVSTEISFYLPVSSRVSIEFFNSRIEKIKEISNQEFPAGSNKVNFSAEGLQPGIYFYRFTCNDFVDVKKMVITK
jgi:hypothetical protein